MIRKTLLAVALTAAPTLALAQQPTQQPVQAPAKPPQAHARGADTTKAKGRRSLTRRAAPAKPKAGAARRDTTARRDSTKP